MYKYGLKMNANKTKFMIIPKDKKDKKNSQHDKKIDLKQYSSRKSVFLKILWNMNKQ